MLLNAALTGFRGSPVLSLKQQVLPRDDFLTRTILGRSHRRVKAVRTADPASTTHFLIDTLKQSRQPPPLLGWDVIRGLYAIGKDGDEELAHVLGDREAATVEPADALSLAQQLGENGLLLYSDQRDFAGRIAVQSLHR